MPEYRRFTSSVSVRMPARRQSLEKKNTPIMNIGTWAHQNQLPQMPCLTTSPLMARGVSAANVVATIEVPRSHQGTPRPEAK